MEWRPLNWKNPHKEDVPLIVILQGYDGRELRLCPSLIYEAGADAMLAALKQEGTYLDGRTVIPATDKYPEIVVPGGTKGWIVQIPDEEGKRIIDKDDLIEDGFGMSASSTCPMCGCEAVYVCRPGDIRCGVCYDNNPREYYTGEQCEECGMHSVHKGECLVCKGGI